MHSSMLRKCAHQVVVVSMQARPDITIRQHIGNNVFYIIVIIILDLLPVELTTFTLCLLNVINFSDIQKRYSISLIV